MNSDLRSCDWLQDLTLQVKDAVNRIARLEDVVENKIMPNITARCHEPQGLQEEQEPQYQQQEQKEDENKASSNELPLPPPTQSPPQPLADSEPPFIQPTGSIEQALSYAQEVSHLPTRQTLVHEHHRSKASTSSSVRVVVAATISSPHTFITG